MPPKPLSTPTSASKEPPGRSKAAVSSVLATLQRLATKKTRDGMARYGIPSDKAFGVSVGALQKLAKQLGRNHELAAALWETGWYEARMLASFVDEPDRVTPAQMDAWCRDFDNWAICDTACFALFDRTPHAWRKVDQWARQRREFVKRAGFALLASLTVHDKTADDELYARGLLLIERAATDDRNFVKKAVNWALRSIGKRSPALHTAAVDMARRLAASANAAARWVGKDALRELQGAAVTRRLARGSRKARRSSICKDAGSAAKLAPPEGFPSGLSQPALRALARANLSTLEQLTRVREVDLLRLHGFGPKGLRTLQAALDERGWSFLS
jgi:3-methyladenine DNA glycosylase AlkD